MRLSTAEQSVAHDSQNGGLQKSWTTMGSGWHGMGGKSSSNLQQGQIEHSATIAMSLSPYLSIYLSLSLGHVRWQEPLWADKKSSLAQAQRALNTSHTWYRSKRLRAQQLQKTQENWAKDFHNHRNWVEFGMRLIAAADGWWLRPLPIIPQNIVDILSEGEIYLSDNSSEPLKVLDRLTCLNTYSNCV